MRAYYSLLIILLTACGGGQNQNPEPLYNLENLSIKLTIKPEKNILHEHLLPLRSYENQTEEVPHFVAKSNESISVFGTFYDESGQLSEDELNAITQNKYFECNYYNDGFQAINVKQNVFEFKTSSDKYQKISVNCDMVLLLGEYGDDERKRTDESFLYPGVSKGTIVILNENPLKEVIPILNELGYSPYKNYDRNGSREIHHDLNFVKKRDKFDLGFINVNQEGPYFFWDENGITNIVFSIREYALDRPNTNDSEKDVEAISGYVSKLTDIDPEHFQKVIICRYWDYDYEEGTEMGDLCRSDKYRYSGGMVNISSKFKLTDTYDNTFDMYDVSISLK